MRTLESWMWSWQKFQEYFGQLCWAHISNTANSDSLEGVNYTHALSQAKTSLDGHRVTDYIRWSTASLPDHHLHGVAASSTVLAKGPSDPAHLASQCLLQGRGPSVWTAHVTDVLRKHESAGYPKRRLREAWLRQGAYRGWWPLQPGRGTSSVPVTSTESWGSQVRQIKCFLMASSS